VKLRDPLIRNFRRSCARFSRDQRIYLPIFVVRSSIPFFEVLLCRCGGNPLLIFVLAAEDASWVYSEIEIESKRKCLLDEAECPYIQIRGNKAATFFVKSPDSTKIYYSQVMRSQKSRKTSKKAGSFHRSWKSILFCLILRQIISVVRQKWHWKRGESSKARKVLSLAPPSFRCGSSRFSPCSGFKGRKSGRVLPSSVAVLAAHS